ncbi:hypothetical protein ACFSUK_29400 [Sphingobium scionense]|uniref:Uncharacterized protein n=1 Tax=Sphingobium scionense TaxID=1404341 RepID=A0A7W6LP19_9SPHN|nr:hypothetical protein [Sphingobium scionense]MBB4147873.1 hypothetical protein [Sphingobium scionense]
MRINITVDCHKAFINSRLGDQQVAHRAAAHACQQGEKAKVTNVWRLSDLGLRAAIPQTTQLRHPSEGWDLTSFWVLRRTERCQPSLA